MFQSTARQESFLGLPKTQQDPLELPGYKLPLDYSPMRSNVYGVLGRSLFPTALDDRDIQRGYADQPLVTLREKSMTEFMEQLTDIPEWWKKVYDDNIAEKWMKDGLNSEFDITPNIAKWIIDELRFKSIIYEKSNAVTLRNGDITKSDSAIPNALVNRLREACKELETGPFHRVEVIPGTGGRQRALIPVGLFPLVYGRSRILTDRIIGVRDALDAMGKGETIPRPNETGITREDMVWKVASRADLKVKPYSTDFQTLPTDLRLGPDGKWHIASYINNLHPVKYQGLYEIFEELFNCATTVDDVTLTPLKDMLHSRARIEYHKAEYYPISQDVLETQPDYGPNESEGEYLDRLNKWRLQNYRAVQPDIDGFKPWAIPDTMVKHLPPDLGEPVRIEEGVQLDKDYGETGLQVFFQIIDVQLSPEKPSHEIRWHIVGHLNEHVCQSSFMLFDGDNIEDVYMHFRQMSETASLADIQHDLDDWVWLKQVFGFEPGDAAVQNTGKIRANIGRLIMYPSTIQSRLGPFTLKDKSKPGFARGLAIYLVDPNIRIISTAHVPPQRIDWTHELQDLGAFRDEVMKLPAYLRDRLLNRTNEFPMTIGEAEELAAAYWKQFYDFMEYQDVAFHSNTIEI